jgi:hypothetical protein
VPITDQSAWNFITFHGKALEKFSNVASRRWKNSQTFSIHLPINIQFSNSCYEENLSFPERSKKRKFLTRQKTAIFDSLLSMRSIIAQIPSPKN